MLKGVLLGGFLCAVIAYLTQDLATTIAKNNEGIMISPQIAIPAICVLILIIGIQQMLRKN